MIEIDGKIISTELFDEAFVCDLTRCKGACCVEGDDGAPLTEGEVTTIEQHLPEISPYMTDEGRAVVEKDGVSYRDRDDEPVTTLVEGKQCAFVSVDDNGTALCTIEQTWRDGKIPFRKPISCHLYPIRIKEYESFDALNYHRWSICSPACQLGEELKVKVFRFAKDAIIRKYGEEFFEKMIEADRHLQSSAKG